MSQDQRLKTHIWVSALLTLVASNGASAVIVRKGDADAGTVAVKLYMGMRRARLYLRSRDLDGQAVWREWTDGTDEPQADRDEHEVEARIAKELAIDPDLWVVEIDDPKGRNFLEEMPVL